MTKALDLLRDDLVQLKGTCPDTLSVGYRTLDGESIRMAFNEMLGRERVIVDLLDRMISCVESGRYSEVVEVHKRVANGW